MQARLDSRGGIDQWTRMREDKLRSLKKALLFSYQSAIVQKYDVKNDNLANNIITIITLLQDQQDLSDTQLKTLEKLQEEYPFSTLDRTSIEYIEDLQTIVDSLVNAQPMFRCLINHDKLKVAYEDKIISIPFLQPPVGEREPQETNFHNGTVFKWIHGNKEQWTPDTYWIVYMQYSEETAYFRAEIRKADEQIQIITIDDEGNEVTNTYHGWMTGPNETSALWNVKKDVVWNDMNYTKLLYITKDENTTAFFERFDRIIINGKPWQIQAYNESYTTSKTGGVDSGIIRVALKETYTSTDQFVKDTLEDIAEQEAKQDEDKESEWTKSRILGPTVVRPFDVATFVAVGFDQDLQWTVSNSKLAKIIKTFQDGKTIKVQIIASKANEEGFDINYGESEQTKVHITIKSI